MKHIIFDRLQLLEKYYERIKEHLLDKDIIQNKLKYRIFYKYYIRFDKLVRFFQLWKNLKKEIKKNKILLEDPEIRILAEEELINNKKDIVTCENKIKKLLCLYDSDDKKNCYLEIRAATGGSESAIFVGDLFKMYVKYFDLRNWNYDIVNLSTSEYGGYKEVIIKIFGKNVYGNLKFESGGHRVQRVPLTESQGRIHTSTCTVAVLPEVILKELKCINYSDLKIDSFRSSGAGGQHVNTTDSAIRITHIPTGIVVECQDERSQHKNKEKALSVLLARIRSIEKKNKIKEESLNRRNLLGSGDRSDRIRTYNFPKSRINDHRIGLTIYRLNEVFNGRLDYLIEPILDYNIENNLLLILDEINEL